MKFDKWEAQSSFRAARVDRGPKSALYEVDGAVEMDSLHHILIGSERRLCSRLIDISKIYI